ncbi:MAG TPA: ornithine carbamoyltransferase [Gaiellales bacterium]|jgi:ornithine carbamoyltransferase|nr:ornithine carbamoyltransferase [Gaiellales bacterium]
MLTHDLALDSPLAAAGLKGRDFLRVDDLSPAAIEAVLDLADHLKALQSRRLPHPWLAGRTLGMIFDKPSTRTRVSFEVGMVQLGGHAVHLSAGESQLGRGEPIEDTGAVLSRYLDAIVIRTHVHARVEELAAASSVPVVNGLTDEHHPCQALADLQVLRERLGGLAGRRLAWVGDGSSNVCHSLAAAAVAMGMEVVVAAPDGYEPFAEELGPAADAVEVVDDPAAAVAGADAVVTDAFTSMGQEAERDARLAALAPYQVNARLLRGAAPGHVVLHCLPAHCGEEITQDVLWGESSAVWDEAENRLHAQKALLAMIV